MSSPLHDYFRLPVEACRIEPAADLPAEPGFFRLGEAVCYGRQAAAPSLAVMNGHLPHDVSAAVQVTADGVTLPFDLSEVVTNLREERYCDRLKDDRQRGGAQTLARAAYYFARPLLPVRVRRHLQRAWLSDWQRIAFPRWPVDTSVDTLMRSAMGLLIRSRGGEELPFVWFWPDGAAGCVMMTHDVEGRAGLDFCDGLMDLDESHGVRSSFQIIPEVRSQLSSGLVERFRARGFEVNIHDLDHDGHLFSRREVFLERVARINRYAREFGCRGFRAGVMYRNQEWFGDLEFSYDMSVPNVAHLEPQRGGCCTVMPYFVGKILELPLTTVQDYSLFNILNTYSLELWKEQIALVVPHNGLVSLNTHPDYLIEEPARQAYVALLRYLREFSDREGTWVAQPGEVNDWWRARSRMTLVSDGGSWHVEGPGSDRARVAHARLHGDRVVYELAREASGRR